MAELSKKIKVAVIDSGINTQMCNLNECVVHSTGFGVNSEGYIEEDSFLPVRNLHGTVVAAIICHICSDVEFVSINILDENLSSDGRILAYSLSQVFDYKPDIIHMSLGTVKKRYIFALKKIVKEAERLNIMLVAAAENMGRVSYPAYLKGVIGVKADNFDDYMNYSYKKGFFYAPAGIDAIDSLRGITELRNAKGTSFSAAYISGHLARILKHKNDLSYKEAKEALLREL